MLACVGNTESITRWQSLSIQYVLVDVPQSSRSEAYLAPIPPITRSSLLLPEQVVESRWQTKYSPPYLTTSLVSFDPGPPFVGAMKGRRRRFGDDGATMAETHPLSCPYLWSSPGLSLFLTRDHSSNDR